MTWKYTCKTGKLQYFWLNTIFVHIPKAPHLLFYVDSIRFIEIILVSNISILKNGKADALSLKNKMKKNGNFTNQSITKYWKVLLHFLHVAFYTMTLQSLRVRLIKLHSSCSAMWDTLCCGSHQSSPITCSIPALDKWQPTSSL